MIMPVKFSKYQVILTHPGVIYSGRKNKKDRRDKSKPDKMELIIKSRLFIQIIKVGTMKAITEA